MDETELYTLRWKGKLIGPLSLAMLQEKFLTGELSLAHEIQVGEQWLTLRNFLSTNPALVTMSSAAPAEETQTFTLRWRGKTMGPYTWAEISEKLSTGELSLAHEIQIGEQWLPLRSCASTDGRPPQAPVESQTPAPAAELPTYTVRWRGQRLGPYSWAEILKKLHAGELSLAHEIQDGENWRSVRYMLNQQPQASVQTKSTGMAAPVRTDKPVPTANPHLFDKFKSRFKFGQPRPAVVQTTTPPASQSLPPPPPQAQ